MEREEIFQLLKNIYAGSKLFEVIEIDAQTNLFTLKNWNNLNIFFQYKIDRECETITICSITGYFKRVYFISEISKGMVMLC